MTAPQLARKKALQARRKVAKSSQQLSGRELVASVNVRNQRELLRDLREARERLDMSVESLAKRIGAKPELVHQAETGEYEVTLTELRHMALGLNAVVEFEVIRQDQSAFIDRLGEFVSQAMRSMDDVPTPWIRHTTPDTYDSVRLTRLMADVRERNLYDRD